MPRGHRCGSRCVCMWEMDEGDRALDRTCSFVCMQLFAHACAAAFGYVQSAVWFSKPGLRWQQPPRSPVRSFVHSLSSASPCASRCVFLPLSCPTRVVRFELVLPLLSSFATKNKDELEFASSLLAQCHTAELCVDAYLVSLAKARARMRT